MQNPVGRRNLSGTRYALIAAAVAGIVSASCKPIQPASPTPVAAANKSLCAGAAVGGRFLTDSALELLLDSAALAAPPKGEKLSSPRRAALRAEMDSVIRMRCSMDSLTAIKPEP